MLNELRQLLEMHVGPFVEFELKEIARKVVEKTKKMLQVWGFRILEVIDSSDEEGPRYYIVCEKNGKKFRVSIDWESWFYPVVYEDIF